MATHRIPILGWQTKPDASGEVFFEPHSIKATNDNWDHLVLVFNNSSSRDGISGVFEVPQDYVGTAVISVVWTTTATSGDVEWDFDYRAIGGNDTESLDQATAQESLNQNDTAPSAAHERLTASLSMTGSNLAAGDTVEFTLFRDGTDGGDTLAAAAIVHGVYFQYSDA